jgi:hypothetical protein
MAEMDATVRMTDTLKESRLEAMQFLSTNSGDKACPEWKEERRLRL